MTYTSNPNITIGPSVLSGEACLSNHKLPISVICNHVRTLGVEATMHDYELSRAEVLTACWFYGAYGIKNVHRLGKFRKTPKYRLHQDEGAVRKWRSWAETYSQELSQGNFDIVPDPPLARWYKRKIQKEQKLISQTLNESENTTLVSAY